MGILEGEQYTRFVGAARAAAGQHYGDASLEVLP
jgi:hypothetical protein